MRENKKLIWKTAVDDPTNPEDAKSVAIFVDHITLLEETWRTPTEEEIKQDPEGPIDQQTIIHLTSGHKVTVIYTLKECLEQLNQVITKVDYD